tara:strand:+ start:1862 stop:2167 length:306 start_codon:yes stop_codon:yes gene_type:complete
MVMTFHNCEIYIPWAHARAKTLRKYEARPNPVERYLTLKIQFFNFISVKWCVPPMLSLPLISLFALFYAVYHVFPFVTLPGQQELFRAINFSTLLGRRSSA